MWSSLWLRPRRLILWRRPWPQRLSPWRWPQWLNLWPWPWPQRLSPWPWPQMLSLWFWLWPQTLLPGVDLWGQAQGLNLRGQRINLRGRGQRLDHWGQGQGNLWPPFYFYSREYNSIAAFHSHLYAIRRIVYKTTCIVMTTITLATPSGVSVADAPLGIQGSILDVQYARGINFRRFRNLRQALRLWCNLGLQQRRRDVGGGAYVVLVTAYH